METQNQNLEGVGIVLSKEKSEEFFHTALCNGLDYVCSSYGLDFIHSKEDYQKAKKTLSEKLKNETICWEDVLMEILRNGGKLTLKDNEGIMGKKSITIKNVHDRVAKTPINHLIEYINDTGGDGTTADVVIQTVFYGDIIYS